MKKEEFIKLLREKLDILEEKEINDIIEEYSGYIDEKIQNGSSEEDAIQDFGDIDELAMELLKAYKINVEKKKKEKNVFSVIVDKVNNIMDSIILAFGNKNSKEILRMLVEIFIILLAIGLCKIPFHFLEEIGYNMFMIFQNNFGRSLYRIWKFIIEFAYLIFAIVLFMKTFEKRYLKNLESEKNRKEVSGEKKSTKKSKSSNAIKKEDTIVKPEKKGIIDYLASIVIWFIKFIAFWILVATAFYIFGLGMCVGICIFLMIKGVSYYGIYISILILLVLGVLVFIGLFNWILNRENNIKMLLIAFATSFVILGISFSYASIEVATTKFINEVPENYVLEEISETIPFTEEEMLFGVFDYEVDETLESEIRISYQYHKDFYNIEPRIEYESQNKVYIHWDYIEHEWNMLLVNDIIEDLKERVVYNYSMVPKVTVYTSSNNIKQLKDNYQKWLKEKRYNYSMYGYCEEQLEEGFELSNYCKEIFSKIE